MRWFETCPHYLQCVCVWYRKKRNQIFSRQETENKALSGLYKQGRSDGLEASCNILLPLEIVFMKRKDLSRGKFICVWDISLCCLHQNHLQLGKKIVWFSNFSRTFFGLGEGHDATKKCKRVMRSSTASYDLEKDWVLQLSYHWGPGSASCPCKRIVFKPFSVCLGKK